MIDIVLFAYLTVAVVAPSALPAVLDDHVVGVMVTCCLPCNGSSFSGLSACSLRVTLSPSLQIRPFSLSAAFLCSSCVLLDLLWILVSPSQDVLIYPVFILLVVKAMLSTIPLPVLPVIQALPNLYFLSIHQVSLLYPFFVYLVLPPDAIFAPGIKSALGSSLPVKKFGRGRLLLCTFCAALVPVSGWLSIGESADLGPTLPTDGKESIGGAGFPVEVISRGRLLYLATRAIFVSIARLRKLISGIIVFATLALLALRLKLIGRLGRWVKIKSGCRQVSFALRAAFEDFRHVSLHNGYSSIGATDGQGRYGDTLFGWMISRNLVLSI